MGLFKKIFFIEHKYDIETIEAMRHDVMIAECFMKSNISLAKILSKKKGK